MAKWRSVALELLPEAHTVIGSADTVMGLWMELGYIYEEALRDPTKRDFIRRILAYADWCADAPRNPQAGRDPPTAVTLEFHERLDSIHARWARESEPNAETSRLRNNPPR